MLRRGSSSRGTRGASTSSRGSSSSRGRGRGASSSSSKSDSITGFLRKRWAERLESQRLESESPHPSPIRRGRGRTYGRPRNAHIHFRNRSISKDLGTSQTTNPPNPFEQERLENAAKREQRSQDSGAVNGRGGRGAGRVRYANKSVRFTSPEVQEPKRSSTGDSSPSTSVEQTSSPFANSSFGAPSTGGTTSKPAFNPFAPASNPFDTSSTTTSSNNSGFNAFSRSAQVNGSHSNPFATPGTTTGAQHTSVFGASTGLGSTAIKSNPFSSAVTSSSQRSHIFGTSAQSGFPSSSPGFNPFQSQPQPQSNISSSSKNGVGGTDSSSLTFGSNGLSPRATKSQALPENRQLRKSPFQSEPDAPFQPTDTLPKNKLATEIEDLLRRHGIVAPPWPTSSPGDPSQKGAVEAFWQTTKAYRAKVRACLIRNGYLDDPDKPKKLSEAIDFKGTCEAMCPEFEKITRIVEHDVQSAEKELSPDGQTYWPSPQKMVKALARSAAGQDAPLPEDVRSPAALRRTLNYLIDSVLGTNDLPTVHGFLWDRTRAIRRDFVFQQSSMTSHELSDQVYCLERITRFHVIALHQMSHEDIVAEDFSEQQEVEQLGKALLSLIHAYEDCMVQGIHCENEPEFRAYYVLFNSHNTGILEAVQDWGWKYWGESDDIRTAVCLVETLQNIWDTQGPLRPHSPADIAQNAYHRFFFIIEDVNVSYTMACFAEIYFNKVRKAALKTILAGYRKQRDQTRDWSLTELNVYLHFDNEHDIVAFGEAYGLHFQNFDGQDYLSFDSDDSMIDPFPQLKQPHSCNLVERKRGHHTLPEVIHRTVYEDATAEDEESLFVPEYPLSALHNQSTQIPSSVLGLFPDPLDDPPTDDSPYQQDTNTPWSPEPKKDTLSTKVQGQTLPSPSSFGKQNPVSPAQENESAGFAAIGQNAMGWDHSRNGQATSIFEEKTSDPRSSVFSFPDQGQASPPIGPSFGTSPYPPPIPAGQTSGNSDIASNLHTATLFPASKIGVISSSFPHIPPASTSTATQSEFVFNAPKQPPPKPVDAQGTQVSTNTSSTPQKLSSSSDNQLAPTKSPAIMKSAPSKSQMPAFADWIAVGAGGLIDQFTEFTVENILMQTVAKYLADEKKRRLQLAEGLAQEEAARFRYRSLATKYCHKWREIAHRLWMRRNGRMAREARRQMAEESLRASRAAESKDVVEQLRASGGGTRRLSFEHIPSATRVLNNVHQPEDKVKNAVRTASKSPQAVAPKTPKRSQTVVQLTNGNSSRPSSNRRGQSEDVLQRTLLSDSAYLHGGSRIHLMRNYSPKMDGRRQPNGVKTDYFRLKARGIMTLPDGTPLANTAAVPPLHQKRSLDNIGKSITPTRPTSKPIANSVPAKPVAKEIDFSTTSVEQDGDIEALKARAKAAVAQDKDNQQKNKRSYLDDEDEELFAKAKRIREQMDENADWFKAEIQKSLSRSSS